MAASSSKAKARAKRGAEQLTKGFRGAFGFLFCLSGIINILALTGAFYMLQIYDRALTSGSVPTLLALSVLAIGLYLFQGMFDVIRSQVLVRMGARLDRRIAPLAHQVAIDMPRFGFSTAEALERGRDVDTVRGFLGSQGPIALFDLPWMPLYLVFVYMLHPWLGGADAGRRLRADRAHHRHRADDPAPFGVDPQGGHRAQRDRRFQCPQRRRAEGDGLRRPRRGSASPRPMPSIWRCRPRPTTSRGTFGAISRVLRMILQSALLGLGAYLTINGELSAGAIIACSVASARALAPVDLAIGNWKSVVAARSAWRRLKETVVALAERRAADGAARPGGLAQGREDHRRGARLRPRASQRGRVRAQGRPGARHHRARPAAARRRWCGRSPASGRCCAAAVRLDEAELAQWDEDALGRNIGYLPQDVALLDATIDENISRFDPEADPRAIDRGGQGSRRARDDRAPAGRLPDRSSGRRGSRCRPASASASGWRGRSTAIPSWWSWTSPTPTSTPKARRRSRPPSRAFPSAGGIAIVVAHRPSALAAVDLVAVIQNGRMTAFGPKSEILRPQASPSSKPARPWPTSRSRASKRGFRHDHRRPIDQKRGQGRRRQPLRVHRGEAVAEAIRHRWPACRAGALSEERLPGWGGTPDETAAPAGEPTGPKRRPQVAQMATDNILPLLLDPGTVGTPQLGGFGLTGSGGRLFDLSQPARFLTVDGDDLVLVEVTDPAVEAAAPRALQQPTLRVCQRQSVAAAAAARCPPTARRRSRS